MNHERAEQIHSSGTADKRQAGKTRSSLNLMNESSKSVLLYSDSPDDSRMIVQLSVGELRALIREEFAALSGHSILADKDILLAPEEAATILGVNSRWLYRHADKLPFTRRISRKNLRFSEAGLPRWIAAKKPDSRR